MSNNKTNSFSDKLSELEDVYHTIKNLDGKELDELIALYQKGLLLSKELEKEIRAFELKITQIKHMHVSHAIEEETPSHTDPHADSSPTLDSPSTLDDIDFSEKNMIDDTAHDEPSAHPQPLPPTPQAHVTPLEEKAQDPHEKDTHTHPMSKYISDLFSDQD